MNLKTSSVVYKNRILLSHGENRPGWRKPRRGKYDTVDDLKKKVDLRDILTTFLQMIRDGSFQFTNKSPRRNAFDYRKMSSWQNDKTRFFRTRNRCTIRFSCTSTGMNRYPVGILCSISGPLVRQIVGLPSGVDPPRHRPASISSLHPPPTPVHLPLVQMFYVGVSEASRFTIFLYLSSAN
jgi:hypothetical protein